MEFRGVGMNFLGLRNLTAHCLQVRVKSACWYDLQTSTKPILQKRLTFQRIPGSGERSFQPGLAQMYISAVFLIDLHLLILFI